MLVLCSLPLLPLLIGNSWQYGFAGLACFGKKFESGRLSEIRPWIPPATSEDGYDGQFYVQIAIDPTLRHSGLNAACDNLAYRAQRIGMPAISYLLGLGHPRWIVQAYGLINLLAWGGLLLWVVQFCDLDSLRGRSMAFALMASSGVLFSVSRALTDLPSLCLCVWAIECQRTRPVFSGCLAAGSLLTKETALLSLFSFIRPKATSLQRTAMRLAAIAMPLVLWLLFVRISVGGNEAGFQNFTWPFLGWLDKIRTEWLLAITNWPRIPLVEMIAPGCIAVQSLYLLLHPQWESAWWRMGATFAVLSLFLALPVWESQNGYTRVLLPLTFAFNMQLGTNANVQQRFSWWYWLGNAGLFPRAIHGLVLWAIVEWIWGSKRATTMPVEDIAVRTE